MKKHELIKHAYDNYHKGTKCISAASATKFICSGIFDVDDNGNIFDDSNGYIIYTARSGDSKWARIINDDSCPEIVIISEDGVDLYEGDSFWWTMKASDGWFLMKHDEIEYDTTEFVFNHNHKMTLVIKEPETNKAFYAKEAALAYIEKHNKSKEADNRVFVMKSDDGVDLYVGDISFVPQLSDEYTYDGEITEFDVVFSSRNDKSKRYSTREAAQKWVDEQNKQKSVLVPLAGNMMANVTKNKIDIVTIVNGTISITPSDLKTMIRTYKLLQ